MRIEILDVDGATVIDTIEADEAIAEKHFPGAWRVAAQQDEPAPMPLLRHITVGAFFDRFGPLKWAILADPDHNVQAVVKDCSVRTFIDLDNPDLPAGLAILQAAGHAIDAQAVIDAPVLDTERP